MQMGLNPIAPYDNSIFQDVYAKEQKEVAYYYKLRLDELSLHQGKI